MKEAEIRKEVKELTTADLNDKIKAEKTEYSKLKLSHAISPLESPIQIRFKRRYIAMLLAEKRSREIKNVQ